MSSKNDAIYLSDTPYYLRSIDIDRNTPAYRRAAYAGFKIEKMRVIGLGFPIDCFSFEADFSCVCGKKERFRKTLPLLNEKDMLSFLMHDPHFTKNGLWDVALELEHFGSFSAEHLRRDGYSEEAIKEIRYIYDLEDEVKKLRRDARMIQLRLSQYEQVPLDIGV